MVTAAFVAATFMNILDTTIVNVALPSIDRDLHTSVALGGLAVVGYLTSLVVVMPISGWLGDRFGTRRIFLIALVTFTAASLVCGLAQDLPELVASRVVQGIGGGAMLPTAMTLLYRVYTPAERLDIAKIITIPTAMGPVLGPTLGGVLVQELSWRWVFWVNVPVGAAIFGLSWYSLVERRSENAGRLDVPGLILSATGIGLLVYGLSQGAEVGWARPQILACLIVAVVVCAALVIVELRTGQPLLRLDLIARVGYREALEVTCLCGAAFSGVQYLLPVMLQLERGYSPLQSGLSTFPEAIGVMIAAQSVSRLHVKLGERTLQLFGFGLLTALLVLFAIASSDLSAWAIRFVMLGVGIGSGHIQTPNQAMAFNEIDAADTGRASGLYSTARRFGSAIGVAALTSAVATSHTATGAASGFSLAFATAAVLAGGGLIIALRAWRQRGRRALHDRPAQVA